MISFSDVHEVLMDGGECSDCEYKEDRYGIRECMLIIHSSNPEFCPGAEPQTDEDDLEDVGDILVVPKLSAYDE